MNKLSAMMGRLRTVAAASLMMTAALIPIAAASASVSAEAGAACLDAVADSTAPERRATVDLAVLPAQPSHSRKGLQFIAPAAMIGIGVWGVAGGWPDHVNHWASNALGGHHATVASDILQFVPDLAMLLPSEWMPASRYNWRDRLMLTVTGEIIVEAITQPTKRLVREWRPDGSDRHSFPSGHAARSFMGAELLREAYGPWIGTAGYAVALTTAYLRIAADRHSLTDLVAGAGVGILSARLAVLLLPLERRWFGFDRQVAIAPAYHPAEGFSLHASIIF